jgi:hypothetical protein
MLGHFFFSFLRCTNMQEEEVYPIGQIEKEVNFGEETKSPFEERAEAGSS